MKNVYCVIFMIAGVAFAAWLCVWVMLYGGIIQAMDNWGEDNKLAALGVIRAILCEIGLLPGAIMAMIGFQNLE